jgi:hypothetical protein
VCRCVGQVGRGGAEGPGGGGVEGPGGGPQWGQEEDRSGARRRDSRHEGRRVHSPTGSISSLTLTATRRVSHLSDDLGLFTISRSLSVTFVSTYMFHFCLRLPAVPFLSHLQSKLCTHSWALTCMLHVQFMAHVFT